MCVSHIACRPLTEMQIQVKCVGKGGTTHCETKCSPSFAVVYTVYLNMPHVFCGSHPQITIRKIRATFSIYAGKTSIYSFTDKDIIVPGNMFLFPNKQNHG